MLNAIGAWLHCRKDDLHKDGVTSQYATVEAPHELSEEEIRLVVERMSNCDVLFPADQAYVTWAVRQPVFVGSRVPFAGKPTPLMLLLRLHLRVCGAT